MPFRRVIVTSFIRVVSSNAKIVNLNINAASFTVNLSKPNTGTTGGNVTFEQVANVFARLSWTEAQA